MIIISVLVIPVLFIQHTATSPALQQITFVANVMIWLASVAECSVPKLRQLRQQVDL